MPHQISFDQWHCFMIMHIESNLQDNGVLVARNTICLLTMATLVVVFTGLVTLGLLLFIDLLTNLTPLL